VPQFPSSPERSEAGLEKRKAENGRLFAQSQRHDPESVNDVTEIVMDRLGWHTLVDRTAAAVALLDYFKKRTVNRPEPTVEAPAPETRVEPIQKRGRTTLDQLRIAAIELYNDPQVGRDRITTQMVAARANKSIGTLYRYWLSRYAMLDDIAPNRAREVITSYERLEPEPEPEPEEQSEQDQP
jgi:hypothetical protein